jgi:hypothetical protein
MSRLPRIIGIVCIVVGALAVVVGAAVYLEVRSQLSAQNITVSSDADMFGGKQVTGPFTAYAQAQALNNHALEAGNGQTYAQLDKNDPARNTVMTADFLQASLYTSVVAFGVSFLIAILGVMFVLVGLTIHELDKRTSAAGGSIDLRETKEAAKAANDAEVAST